MNAIVPFNFGELPVRIEDRDGALWFVLSDVCRVLGIANVADAAGRLDDDEKDDIALTDTIGREQATVVINESGLYRLVLRSRKESARRFSKWVTADVLPTIRRTGGFGMPAAPQLDDATLRAMLLGKMDQVDDLKAENVELSGEAAALEQISDSSGLLCMSDAAKTVGMGPRRFIAWLMLRGWIFRRTPDSYSASQARLNDRTLMQKTIRIPKSDGTMRITQQVMVTAKGLTKVAEMASAEAPTRRSASAS